MTVVGMLYSIGDSDLENWIYKAYGKYNSVYVKAWKQGAKNMPCNNFWFHGRTKITPIEAFWIASPKLCFIPSYTNWIHVSRFKELEWPFFSFFRFIGISSIQDITRYEMWRHLKIKLKSYFSGVGDLLFLLN